MASCIYLIALPLAYGYLLPDGITAEQILWLAASGFVGLVLGDGAGFKALVMIGPRLTTLLWATAPIMTTVIAWFLLDEQLHMIDLLGIALAVGGIAWVISERQYKTSPKQAIAADHPDAGTLFKGVLLGLVAALGQAAGLVMSKHAMLNFGSTIEAMPASFIRIGASMLFIWTITAFRGKLPSVIAAMKERPAMLFSFGGALMGPFLGVWLSLVAVQYIEAGFAATLNSLTPILIIPLVIGIYKEKVSPRAVIGAVVAFVGVALLFLGEDVSRFFQSH